MKIEFIDDTLGGIVAQLRAFIGEADGRSPAPKKNDEPLGFEGRTVPSWAPAGSAWVETPGAPTLIGPDGVGIAVDWSSGAPAPGAAVVRHDAAAEAAGAALLEATRSSQR